jgi:biopolymer transport protein ExbB/TolQ
MGSVDISPVAFFLSAGPIGKGVMGILLLSSIWCWVLIIDRIVGVFRAWSASRARARRRTACSAAAPPSISSTTDANSKRPIGGRQESSSFLKKRTKKLSNAVARLSGKVRVSV